jgi:cytochrome P450
MHEICGKEGLQVKLIGDNIVFSNGKDWTRHRKVRTAKILCILDFLRSD